MSASTGRGPGRPTGSTSETQLAQKQEILLLHRKYSLTAKQIADANGMKPSWVYEIIKKAGADEAQTSEPPAEARQPVLPRRLSRRIVAARAWEIVDRAPTPWLGLDGQAFWIRVVVAIHEHGDGFRLGISAPGSQFETRGDLARLFMQTIPLSIDEWLAALIRRGRLLDIDGVDIGIPAGLGLLPGENSRGEPIKPRVPKRPSATDQTHLPYGLRVVSGGREDSGEINPSDSGETPIPPESDSGEITPDESGQTPISPESENLARAASAAAYAKEKNDLAAAAAAARGARDSGEIHPDSGEIPPGDSGEIPPGDSGEIPLASLTAELVALAGIDRAANPDDLGTVQAWLDDGFSIEAIRALIAIKLGQLAGRPVTTLAYFSKALRQTREVGRRSPPPAAAPVPPASTGPPPDPEPPEDPALAVGDSPEAQWARVNQGLKRVLTPGVHRTWLKGAALVGIEDDEATISVPSEFLASHARKEFLGLVTQLWQDDNPDIVRVSVVAARGPPHPTPS